MTPLHQAWRELNLARHRAELYGMWRLGYSAGLQHTTVLSKMGEFRRSHTVRRLRQVLIEGLRRGNTIAETIRAEPDLVVPFEFALLRLGEETGKLEEALKMLSDHFTAEHRTMLAIKKKLAYPVACLIAAIFIAPFPILFFGNALLYSSVVALELSGALLVGGAALAATAAHFGKQSNVVLGRFCRALALAIEAGLPLDRVAELAVLAADDPVLTRDWRSQVVDGRGRKSLAETFASSAVVPRAIIAALEVAEASGDYNGTVRKLAQMYDGP